MPICGMAARSGEDSPNVWITAARLTSPELKAVTADW